MRTMKDNKYTVWQVLGILVKAWGISEGFLGFIFHIGYQKLPVPRNVRKLFAKSRAHRAWLAGFTGLGILSIMELNVSDNLR